MVDNDSITVARGLGSSLSHSKRRGYKAKTEKQETQTKTASRMQSNTCLNFLKEK